MNERQYDLVVAGEINPDLILSGNVMPEFGQVEKIVEDAALTIGSSSVIFACGAARLGLRVAFIGKCGDDLFGRFMLDEMQKRDVDIEHVFVVPGKATGMSVILNRGGDRAILTATGLTNALCAEDLSDELLQKSRHLHVASYFLQDALRPGLLSLFERAQRFGLTTSLDTNYDPTETWAGVYELLAATNVFLPNEVEAKNLSGKTQVQAACDTLKLSVETLVIKLGAQGAIAANRDECVRSESIAMEVIDTVGAGDSFDAGFIYGYLQGWPLQKSLRLGCVCGALSTRAAGGTMAQPTLVEASRFI